MTYNNKEIEFPAILQVSFFKLVEQLEKQAKGEEDGVASYAKELLEEVEKYPELRDGITDISALSSYQKSIDKLAKPLFPEVLTNNEIKILSPPFHLQPMYSSQRFKNIVEASGESFSFTMRDVDENLLYLYCCYFILKTYYEYPVVGATPQFYEIENTSQGLNRVYKLLINVDMCEFTPTDRAVDISKEDYEELIDNFGDLELWKKKFPPNSWIMKGLSIINLVDVTADQSINSITSDLLSADLDTFKKIQLGIKKLLNNSKLCIGVMSLQNDQLVAMEKIKGKSMNSLLLSSGKSLNCELDLCDYSFHQLISKKEPVIITDIKKFHANDPSNFSKQLIKSKFESYIIAPVVHEDELLGFLEIGSKNRYELHEGSLTILNQILPILSMAKKRFHTEAQNLVEAIIQQECTTIHPSVKWKFEKEATKFMERQKLGKQPIFKDIVFDRLYPLYGQLDIKGSSKRRNHAVCADLIKQLKMVLNVIEEISSKNSMPIHEELIYRIHGFIDELKEDLAAGSEHKILNFLKQDVYSVLDYFKKTDESLRSKIENYYRALDTDMHTVYEERKKYDISVNKINQHLAAFIDQKQIDAQRMFPHYFERYKTDGVEFNIYIGQSITKDHDFDMIFVRNLRLWQLLVMCEMEIEFQAIKQEIGFSIEVASLILIYNTPIAVHFRMDEKKFDVEGAYNARYEIIKKRVDKAHIKGTNERVTRPGSIAIVYSQDQDAKEYKTYLQFLASKGYLKEGIEDLELEDLQGVHGLKALRVDVDYSEINLTVDEFIEEMENSMTEDT
ncbi:MAG: GAF domain-containing protein [Bacteroidota bacterium]